MRPSRERGRGGGSVKRLPSIPACLICCLGLAGPSWGQSLTDGPLAGPDAPALIESFKGRPPAHAKTSAAKNHAARTTRWSNAQAADLDGRREPAPSTAKPAPSRPAKGAAPDPFSLGMKWNGSNDNAEQTRIQNYGGSAPGTGASVGLNYHF